MPTGVEGEYYFEKEIAPSDLTKGDCFRIYVSATGEKNPIVGVVNNKTDNTYLTPWSIKIKSISRRGRETVTIKNIGDGSGWNTYCSPNRLEYSRKGDMNTYIVSSRAENGDVNLKKVSIAPEGTPVILNVPDMEGMESVTFGIPSTSLAADNIGTNLLLAAGSDGVQVPNNDGYTYYALANKTDGIGFYKVKAGVTIPEGKAYLKFPNAANAREYIGMGSESDTPSDIKTINQTAEACGDSLLVGSEKMRVRDNDEITSSEEIL